MQRGKCRLDIRNHFFPEKAAKGWSRLPREVQMLEGCKGCAEGSVETRQCRVHGWRTVLCFWVVPRCCCGCAPHRQRLPLAAQQLYCRSVWSARSGLTRHSTAVARCAGTEEMLSCSSFSRSGRRLGEHMEDKDEQKQCVAHNAFRGRGAYAIARCCTWPSAECRINASSAAGAGCSQQDHLLTGCSFRSSGAALGDGGRPVPGPGDRASHCSGVTGVTAHASCCPAASLQCRVKERTSPGPAEKVTVSCEDGWTLTGCNAHPHSPGTMGAYAVDNTCVAARGPGSGAATAVAICCRSQQ